MTTRTTTVRLWPVHKRIPKGWKLVGSAGRHRDKHARPIEKLPKRKRKVSA